MLIHDQCDVFHGGKHVDELEMLMNHADAQGIGILRAANFSRLSIDQKLTAVRVVYTGDHVHQRRFAAAVFAQQGENFSSADGQGDIAVGNNAAECLGNMAQFNGILHKVPFTPSK